MGPQVLNVALKRTQALRIVQLACKYWASTLGEILSALQRRCPEINRSITPKTILKS